VGGKSGVHFDMRVFMCVCVEEKDALLRVGQSLRIQPARLISSRPLRTCAPAIES